MSSTDRSAAKSSQAGAVRLLAIVGCAATLAGCMTDRAAMSDRAVVPEVPNDVRQRHPIAIREGVHTVEIFIGTKRGTDLDQHGDARRLSRAPGTATAGGVAIDLPSGTSNATRAAGALLRGSPRS